MEVAAKSVEVAANRDGNAANSPKRRTDGRIPAGRLRESRTRGAIIPRRREREKKKKAWKRSQKATSSARSGGAFGGDLELEFNLVAARTRIHTHTHTHTHVHAHKFEELFQKQRFMCRREHRMLWPLTVHLLGCSSQLHPLAQPSQCAHWHRRPDMQIQPSH